MIFTYEHIDRTLFHHLRLKLVEMNLLPDVLDFQYTPTSQATQDFKNKKIDMANLQSSDSNGFGFIVEIFGNSTSEARDEKTAERIVVTRTGDGEGSIGGGTTFYEEYEENSVRKFRKWRIPETTADIQYEVRLIYREITSERMMQNVVLNSLGRRKSIEYWNSVTSSMSEGKEIFIERLGGSNVSGTDVGEAIINFVVRDVWLGSYELVAEGIPELRQVDICPILTEDVGSDDESVSIPFQVGDAS